MKNMKKLVIFMLLIVCGTVVFAQNNKDAKDKKEQTKSAEKMYSCPMHPEVTSLTAGKCPKCNMSLTLSKKEQMKMEVMKLYACPMHPNVVSDKAGKCSECGMTLEEKKSYNTNNKGKM